MFQVGGALSSSLRFSPFWLKSYRFVVRINELRWLQGTSYWRCCEATKAANNPLDDSHFTFIQASLVNRRRMSCIECAPPNVSISPTAMKRIVAAMPRMFQAECSAHFHPRRRR